MGKYEPRISPTNVIQYQLQEEKTFEEDQRICIDKLIRKEEKITLN